MFAERLYHRKYYFTGLRIYGIALYEVEEAVGVSLFVGVYAVEVHNLQQGQVVESGHRQVVDLCAGCVAQVFYVQFETVFLYLVSSERIDVFHHQIPHWHCGGCRCAF